MSTGLWPFLQISKDNTLNNTITLLIVSILVALNLSSCSMLSKYKLLGKWQDIQKTGVIEFFSDNRVSIAANGQTAAGDWSILGDGRVKLEITIFGTTYVSTGKVEGDILRLETPDGEVSEYQRLKSRSQNSHADKNSIASPDEELEPENEKSIAPPDEEFEPERVRVVEEEPAGKSLHDNYIGDFTAKLADAEESHYIKLTDLTLKYDPIKYKLLAAELGEKDSEIKDAINAILIRKTSEVNSVKGKEKLNEEIKEKINSMLVKGQIPEVLFQVIVQ